MDNWTGYIEYTWQGKVIPATFGPGTTTLQEGLRLHLYQDGQDDESTLRVEIECADPVEFRSLYLEHDYTYTARDRIFCNGYQSWTESRLFQPEEKIPRLRIPFPSLINTTGDYTFYPNHGNPGFLHSYSYSYITRPQQTLAIADLIPESGYLIVEWQVPFEKIRLREECAGRRITGKALLLHTRLVRRSQDRDRPDRHHLTAALDRTLDHLQAIPAPPIAGWTSWYYHYTQIDQDTVHRNLEAFHSAKLPIDLFQIDDGWQPAIGDWLEANDKFPAGMAALASRIRSQGYQPGLWLAPFIVEQKSRIYQDHPDWLLTYDGERPVEGGFNPGWGGILRGTYYVLDLDHEEVRSHLRRVFDRVLNQWGFELVKLDFLFAAALIPRNGRCRGQHMAAAMDFLRECCGDKLILGCGVPLGPSFGKVDYCRIGPDIGLGWEMASAKFARLRERISTHNALGNTIARHHLDRRAFGNDPDVFILRQAKTQLKPAQKRSLFLVNALFGRMFLTSDNPAEYDADTLALYRNAFPLLERTILGVDSAEDFHRIRFEVAGRSYLALVNLGRHLHKSELDEGIWYQAGRGWTEGITTLLVSGYTTNIFLQADPLQVAVAGDEGHIFPGAGIRSVEVVEGELMVGWHKQASRQGDVWIQIPEKVMESGLRYAGKPVTVERKNGLHLFRIPHG